MWPQSRSGHGGKTELIEHAENQTLVVQPLSQFSLLADDFDTVRKRSQIYGMSLAILSMNYILTVQCIRLN